MAAPFGSSTPYAEPAWYSRDNSPYYKDSHRKLRAYVRNFVDTELIPIAAECEAQGVVPDNVCSSLIHVWSIECSIQSRYGDVTWRLDLP